MVLEELVTPGVFLLTACALKGTTCFYLLLLAHNRLAYMLH